MADRDGIMKFDRIKPTPEIIVDERAEYSLEAPEEDIGHGSRSTTGSATHACRRHLLKVSSKTLPSSRFTACRAFNSNYSLVN